MQKPSDNRISLPKGVLVDPEDYGKLEGFNTWFISKRGDVYSQKWKDGKAKTYKLHRVIMGAEGGHEVDHINRNKLDNRRTNLRVCSHADNGKNLPLKRNNKSGFSGVCFDSSRRKWSSSIKVDYKNEHLGRFDTIEEAISARLFGESYYYGEFAPNA